MADEQHTSAGRIMSIEAVAIRVVREDPEPAHPSASIDSWPNIAPILKTQSHPEIVVSNGQRSQSSATDEIGFPMSEPSPVWSGEIKAPNREESLNSIMPRERGRLRLAILAGMLIGASGVAWWAGLFDPYRLFNSDPASPAVQHIALPERAPLDIDKQATSAITDAQGSPPVGADLGSKAREDTPSPYPDEGAVAPADSVSPQNTTATKPAIVPHVREKKSANYPAPFPETRPKTMDGWTARQVSGRTAVLQGPTGMWTVSVGDTVPGAGRIDSIVRWGNRWIVATSKGLITTD